MTPSPDNHDKLERAIHQTLRSLPARRAPRALEQRVLVELQRRTALPWWRKSFTHWPVPARAAFLVVLVGIVKLLLLGSVWAMAGFDPYEYRAAFAQQLAWMETVFTVAHAITSSVEIVLRNLPPLWLYGGLMFFACLYFTFFGLGAAAYKALRAQH